MTETRSATTRRTTTLVGAGGDVRGNAAGVPRRHRREHRPAPISVDLDASTSALQWVIDAYVLVLAGLLLLCGSIGDRYGRKRMMSIGLVVFGLAAAGAALADSTGLLIAMRALQGLGAALVLPATLSIIVSVFPRRAGQGHRGVDRGRRPRIALGPVAGGSLIESSDWSAAFWLFIPLVAAALAGMTIVPESRDPRRVGLDIPGAILGTAGLTALVYGIIRGGEVGWDKGTVLGSFAAAAVLLVPSRWSRPGPAHRCCRCGSARARPRRCRPVDRHRAVRDVRDVLLPHPVLPDRPGTQRARGRPAAGRPGGRHDRRLRDGREAHPHRRAARSERGDGRGRHGAPRLADRHHRGRPTPG